MNDTIKKVSEVLANYTDYADITLETTWGDMGLDSLDAVDIVMKLEIAFSMQIPMSDKLKTVGDVVNFIDEAKKG